MPTRDEITQWRRRHDPAGEEIPDWMLAVVWVMTREINTLRQQLLLPPRTKEQVITAIRTAVADLTVD